MLAPASAVLNGFVFPVRLYAWLEEELLPKRALLGRVFLTDAAQTDKLTRLKLNRVKYESYVLS
jgi:hypothetical protein